MSVASKPVACQVPGDRGPVLAAAQGRGAEVESAGAGLLRGAFDPGGRLFGGESGGSTRGNTGGGGETRGKL